MRSKSGGESNFADSQIRISQEITRLFKTRARDVRDQIYSNYLLERLTEMWTGVTIPRAPARGRRGSPVDALLTV
jgi:hypothetical protein